MGDFGFPLLVSWPFKSLMILSLAALLDYAIGDPWGWPHPVRFMGSAIAWGSHIILKHTDSTLAQRWAGVLLALVLIGGSGGIGWLIAWGSSLVHPLLGIGLQSIGLASCFACRSLRTAAEDVLQP